MKTIGYAADSATSPLAPFRFDRREFREDDVAIEILYSGICHSDIHTVNGDWGPKTYPLVPGHEILGKVIDIGPKVTKYAKDDIVAVGCMVDSCLACPPCKHGEEQHCHNGMTPTYAGKDRISNELTQGGYSKHIVVKEAFVLKVPNGLDISKAAPLLCAGITSYSPLKHWGVKKGTRVGVIGLGGLGHMAIKLAVAMGADVTVISRSAAKQEVANALGANKFLASENSDSIKSSVGSLDLIINTIPVKHDLTPYISLLDINGTLVIVGQIGPVEEIMTPSLIFGRKRVAGSLIGGIAETQEVLDFCAKNNILPDCKIIPINKVNSAWSDLKSGNPHYRYVIDMSTLDIKE